MNSGLSKRQLDALQKLDEDDRDFRPYGVIGLGVGKVTMEQLVAMGLAETGMSVRHHGEHGCRITDYGKKVAWG